MNFISPYDPEKSVRLKRMIFPSVCIALVLFLALLEYLAPLRTLLPAARIAPRKEGEMRVHFLDVGEGDCTVVEFPDGDVLVVDAGEGTFEAENAVIRFLKGLHPSSVSLLATHAALDHYGGFSELLNVFEATTVYTPPTAEPSAAYERFLSGAESGGAEVVPLARYSVISRPSGAYCVCVSPASSGEEDGNDGSAVLFVSYGGVNLLLGADISAKQEEKLLTEYALLEGIFDSGEFRVRLEDTNVLKVSHHGSADASSEEWLSLLCPEAAIVTCGRGNGYSHPAAESMARLSEIGAEIYRTDELGNITISILDGNFTILE